MNFTFAPLGVTLMHYSVAPDGAKMSNVFIPTNR